MATLGFTNDWVQLPEDGTGKKTGYYRWDTGGGSYLYLGAGVIVSATGDIAPVSATAGLKVDLGADNDVTISDGGGSITIDGSVIAVGDAASGDSDIGNPVKVGGRYNSTQPTLTNAQRGDIQLDTRGNQKVTLMGLNGQSAAAVVLGAGSANIGDVNIDSLPGQVESDITSIATSSALVGGAVSGTELQVDIVAELPAGTNNIGDVDVLSLPALPAGTNNIGDVDVLTLPALPAGNNNIGDVDVASLPALVAGNANIGDVDIASVAAGTTIEVVGDVASDIPVAANPITVGGRASAVAPSAVSADGDAVNAWLTRLGAQVVAGLPHLGLIGDVYTLTSKTVQQTTAQTGTDVLTPTSGKKLVIVSYQIQAGGTTSGTVQLWFGANADTAYTRGTDLAIFDGEFAPSSTSKPGIAQTGLWVASAVDHEVHLTTSANITLTVTLWYYEI